MSAPVSYGPNEALIGVPGWRERLATPALVLDLDIFERNLARMRVLLDEAGMRIRPHAKTHKCSEIARRQIEAGTLGVCVASMREAEAMCAADIGGVLITSPVAGEAKIERLKALLDKGHDLMTVVDHPDNLGEVAAAARSAGRTLEVLVDLDIGMHRTGAASPADALALARLVTKTEGVSYRGIQGYSGRVQHIEPYDERDRTYGAQLEVLETAVRALTEAGLAPDIVTGGGTGTLGIDRARRLINEHQAGSYIFMDVEYNAVEILRGENQVPFDTALVMRNTVVSVNTPGYATIDGGFKCFATDGPVPQIHGGAPEGAHYEYYGDEHGRIVFADAGDSMPLGAGVDIVTPHCDPTVNLHDYYHVVQGDMLVDIWPIDGRGVL